MTNSLEPSPSTPSFGVTESSRASWRWRFEDGSGGEVQPPEGGVAAEGGSFPSQGDAESWIGEVWRDLLDEGVDQVSLFEADRQVYGPMSLHTTS
jgi:hypothetical protein